MSAPYARRAITVTFQLGEGSFGAGGFDSVTFAGLRVYLQAEWSNLGQQPQAFIRIFGMTLDTMNKLTKAGLQFITRVNNNILVEAGDFGSTLTQVFKGTVIEAYPDFKDMPNTSFLVRAVGANELQLKPVKPTTFAGAVPFDTVMEQVLSGSGYTHQANGVKAVLASPYLPGTVMAQANRALRAANAFGAVDPLNNVITTWPKNGSQSGGALLVSPATGMIGYPDFEQMTITVRHRFDPRLNVSPSHKIQVDSQLTAAKGIWNLIRVDLNLASETPDGPWEMVLHGYNGTVAGSDAS